MAYYMGNLIEDKYPEKIQISSEEFHNFIDEETIPSKALSPQNDYFYVPNNDTEITNSEIFIIFNPIQSFYYLFHI
jgi:hypothetical protein